MADKTVNTKTAYLTLQVSTSEVNIDVYTTNPVYFTNSQVTFYLKVTLDSYVSTYPAEATYYEPFKLNMKNCQVTSFTKDTDQSQEYILYTPTEKYPYSFWTDNPKDGYIPSGTSCGYTI